MKLRRSIRILMIAVLVVFAYAILAVGPSEAKKSTRKQPCRVDLAHCPDEGCGSDFDPNPNRLKNIRPNDPRTGGTATARSLGWMKNLDDPEEFQRATLART